MTTSMRVKVLYFAAVRDLLGMSEEEVTLPPGISTISAFAEFLEGRHPLLKGRLSSVRFACNEAFATGHEPVLDGDVIAVIPPVAGG